MTFCLFFVVSTKGSRIIKKLLLGVLPILLLASLRLRTPSMDEENEIRSRQHGNSSSNTLEFKTIRSTDGDTRALAKHGKRQQLNVGFGLGQRRCANEVVAEFRYHFCHCIQLDHPHLLGGHCYVNLMRGLLGIWLTILQYYRCWLSERWAGISDIRVLSVVDGNSRAMPVTRRDGLNSSYIKRPVPFCFHAHIPGRFQIAKLALRYGPSS